MNETARYPSHLISKSQLGSSKGFSVMDASMGRIALGMGRFTALSKSLIAEDAEESSLLRLPSSWFSFFFAFGFDAAASTFFRFSAFARLSASHGAFSFPPEAFLLLVHSAESSSPAICPMVFLLSTEASYWSMSKPDVSYSSCFLIINHSLPLLPGRRAFM